METGTFVTLVYLDSFMIAMQYLYRQLFYELSLKEEYRSYGDIYHIKSWLTRYIHYLIVSTVTWPLTWYNNMFLYIIVLTHFPVIFNYIVRNVSQIQNYMQLIDREQDRLIRFMLLVMVTKVIERHTDKKHKINATKLFPHVDTVRLVVMAKTMSVLYLLTYLKSYDHLYIYYKIAKYIYYYNYRYNVTLLSETHARQNINTVIDNQAWSALTEPIFVHSILTLEATRSSHTLFHVLHRHLAMWASYWTIGQVTNSILTTSLVYLAIQSWTTIKQQQQHVQLRKLIPLCLTVTSINMYPFNVDPQIASLYMLVAPKVFSRAMVRTLHNFIKLHYNNNKHGFDHIDIPKYELVEGKDGYIYIEIHM